jgi:hypothetical protein
MSQAAPQGPPEAPPPGWRPPKKPFYKRPLPLTCLGVVVLLIIIIIAISAAANKAIQPTAGNAYCSPTPCGQYAGLTVNVLDVNRNAPADEFSHPEAGNHFVKLDVQFKSAADGETHANPLQFVLLDPAGVKHSTTVISAAGCQIWSAVNLTKGAQLGPKPLCFEASGDLNGKLTLVWTPGLSDVNIPLQ